MDVVINQPSIRILSDAAALFQSAALDFARRAIAAIHDKQLFSVVLSGGQTPKLFFDTLVNAQEVSHIPWQQIKFFFGDERYVPANDEASNYHMAYQHLFSKVPVLPENIYPVPTHLPDPHAAANDYEQTIRSVFNNELPLFDLVYLGLGTNAHTASLMPESEVVKAYLEAGNSTEKLVAALWVPELQMYRITLTPPALNNSKAVCFLVQGADKAAAVQEVLRGPVKPLQYPAQLIRCARGETVWYLDEKAAEKL